MTKSNTEPTLQDLQRAEQKSIILDAITEAMPMIVANLLTALKQQPQNEKNGKEYLTRKQVADLFHVRYNTIHTWMRDGTLPYVKAGRKTLFEKSAVDALPGRYARR